MLLKHLLSREVFEACTGGGPWTDPGHTGELVSRLAWECLSIPSEELEKVWMDGPHRNVSLTMSQKFIKKSHSAVIKITTMELFHSDRDSKFHRVCYIVRLAISIFCVLL